MRGFLLAESGESISVLTDDLVQMSFAKAQGATFEPIDLERLAADRLAGRDEWPQRDPWKTMLSDPDREGRWFAERLHEPANTFVLARQCAENGLGTVAHNLLDSARREYRKRRGDFAPRPIEEDVADGLATVMFWREALDCADPSSPRSRLLDEYRWFLATFPNSEQVAEAKEAVAILEVMVAEDAEHARSLRPWESMSKHEQIAELIWRLRDDGGLLRWNPGGRDKEPTTRAQLVASGFDAVPRLIAAIDDQRFTRHADFWRQCCHLHSVWRVGDAALRALGEVAHRPFCLTASAASAMTPDEQAVETRRLVETWWAEQQTTGDRRIPPR